MHDLATIRRRNDEAADRELEKQRRLIARLETRFRSRGIEIDLGETIQSAVDEIGRRIQEASVRNRSRAQLGPRRTSVQGSRR